MESVKHNGKHPLPYGGNPLKTPDEFKQLAEAEYQVKYNAMVDEFKERKQALALSRDRKVDEYRLMSMVIALNSATQKGDASPTLMMQVEREIAALDYETAAASFSLQYWRTQYGEQMIVPVLCDVMNYFFRQFQVKEILTDVQIMQLAIKLLSAQPALRVRELLLTLNNALHGAYGPTYQRIGIDSILQWLHQFYADSSAWLESKMINTQPAPTRGTAPWDLQERQLKAYHDEQRKKYEGNAKILNAIKARQEPNTNQ